MYALHSSVLYVLCGPDVTSVGRSTPTDALIRSSPASLRPPSRLLGPETPGQQPTGDDGFLLIPRGSAMNDNERHMQVL